MAPEPSATRRPAAWTGLVGRGAAGGRSPRRSLRSPAGRSARARPEPAASRCRRCTAPGRRAWFGPGTVPAVLLGPRSAGGAPPGSPTGCPGAACCSRRTPRRWRGCSRWPSSTVVGDRARDARTATTTSTPPAGVTDVPALLDGWVPRIDADHPDNWPTHVAGPPAAGAAVLRRAGPGRARRRPGRGLVGDASWPRRPRPPVLVTLRALGAEAAARRAAPFLVLGPGGGLHGVSADAVFAAVAAWGLAVLALAATSTGRGPMVAWSLLAGLLLGCCVMMSYGLPLLGFLALAVLALARSWRPLPVPRPRPLRRRASASPRWASRGGRPTRCCTSATGAGLASERPAAYWMWAQPRRPRRSSAGPAARRRASVGLVALRRRADPAVALLVAAAAAAVLHRRPVPDEPGRGGADLAAVRAVAAALDGPAARALATAGAGRSSSSRRWCWSTCSTPAGEAGQLAQRRGRELRQPDLRRRPRR